MVLFAKISFDIASPNDLRFLQILPIIERNVLGMVLITNKRFFHPRIMHPLDYTVHMGIEKCKKSNVQKNPFTTKNSYKKNLTMNFQ